MTEEQLPTFGQFITGRLREVVESVMTPMPDSDGLLVPFPEFLIYADVEHDGVIGNASWLSYEDKLQDIMERVAFEGVLLSIGSLEAIEVGVQHPMFLVLSDMLASYYARGFLLGMIEGEAGAPTQERMDDYLEDLAHDVDEQLANQLLVEYDDEDWLFEGEEE